MNIEIDKNIVRSIKLDYFNLLIKKFPYLKNKGEHYRLLVYLSKYFNGKNIMDAGTCQGHSCLSLCQNKNNEVISYDIVRNRSLYNFSEHNNVVLKLLDINKEKEDIVNSFRFIVLDINPHDGKQEKKFLERLRKIKYKGFVVCDDIHLNSQMSDWWESVDLKKNDVTDVGHSSGTGIITFGDDNFVLKGS